MQQQAKGEGDLVNGRQKKDGLLSWERGLVVPSFLGLITPPIPNP